jgi:hypothetical protein|tara:strand:+ start:768 stop:1592 length:825 start_codon:yes stop_codon:yes gene_type:complete
MTAVFRVNTLVIPSQVTPIPKCPRAIFGFRSLLPDSTIVNFSGSGVDEDLSYPFSNCLDYRDNTKYSPTSELTVEIEFRQSSATAIDYFGIAVHNGSDVGFTGKFEVQVLGSWVKVADIATPTNNGTVMGYFDEKNSSRQRLTLNYTGKLYIGTIYVGKSWEMKSTPDKGFIPGRSNSIDEVQGFNTKSEQFVIGRKMEKGNETKGSFSNVDFSIINSEYLDFMNHVQSPKPMFFKWNSDIEDNFFGMQKGKLTPPSYSNSNRGTISFNLIGRA